MSVSLFELQTGSFTCRAENLLLPGQTDFKTGLFGIG